MEVVAAVYVRSVPLSISVKIKWYSLIIPFRSSVEGAVQLSWRTVELRMETATSSGDVFGAVEYEN